MAEANRAGMMSESRTHGARMLAGQEREKSMQVCTDWSSN